MMLSIPEHLNRHCGQWKGAAELEATKNEVFERPAHLCNRMSHFPSYTMAFSPENGNWLCTVTSPVRTDWDAAPESLLKCVQCKCSPSVQQSM